MTRNWNFFSNYWSFEKPTSNAQHFFIGYTQLLAVSLSEAVFPVLSWTKSATSLTNRPKVGTVQRHTTFFFGIFKCQRYYYQCFKKKPTVHVAVIKSVNKNGNLLSSYITNFKSQGNRNWYIIKEWNLSRLSASEKAYRGKETGYYIWTLFDHNSKHRTPNM